MRQTALETIAQLIRHNPKIVFVGSDLGAGTLRDVQEEFPTRVFMEGIAEQHVVGFAAGLAMEGFVPFVHTIGTFLTRRALEQVIIDVCLHRLPVRLIASGGGMVYAPLGPTHQATDDFALMRAIPDMQVFAPADPLEMSSLIGWLSESPYPAYVRVAKGGESVITEGLPGTWPGPIRLARLGDDATIITTGALLAEALSAADTLGREGVSLGVVHVPTLAPLDCEGIMGVFDSCPRLIVLEEHMPVGGLWSALAELSVQSGVLRELKRLGLPHRFADRYGSQRDHWDAHQLSSEGIVQRVREIVRS